METFFIRYIPPSPTKSLLNTVKYSYFSLDRGFAMSSEKRGMLRKEHPSTI